MCRPRIQNQEENRINHLHRSNRGALRGTTTRFWSISHSMRYTTCQRNAKKPVVDELLENGFLDQAARDFINPNVIWNFLSSPWESVWRKHLGRGRIHKEQQFIIGIPAREMGLGDSDELVLIRESSTPIWRKRTDWSSLTIKQTMPEGSPEQGAKMLAERYRVQLDYYESALTQLTENM